MSSFVQSSSLPTLAVFDFDGTLTYRDSFFPFLRFMAGNSQFFWGILLLSPILLGYLLKIIPNDRAKEKVLIHFLRGKEQQKLQNLADRFAAQHLPKLLRPEALNRLQWHQQQGHQTILVSASLELYLLPWGKIMNFNHVLGTQLVLQESYHTGRILGQNCYGKEKIRRLENLLGDLSQYCLYAYGDSSGDIPLLKRVTYPYYRKFTTVTKEFPRQDR